MALCRGKKGRKKTVEGHRLWFFFSAFDKLVDKAISPETAEEITPEYVKERADKWKEIKKHEVRNSHSRR
jgi:hypothetical protein